jgi:hypothetical protein
MKILKSMAIMAATLVSLNGYSQGLVSFANDNNSLVRTQVGAPAPAGLLVVGLYFNPNPDAVADPTLRTPDGFQLAPANVSGSPGSLAPSNVGSPLAGRFIGGTKYIDGVDFGQRAAFQVRAWSAGFATYEEAYAAGMANTSILVGYSDVLRFATGGGGSNPATSITTQGGLMSFAVMPVPEPSMIALSVLGGLGAMLLIRRRR